MIKFNKLIFSLLLLSSCSFVDEEYEIKSEEWDIAVPIAFGSLDIQDVIDNAKGVASLRVDGSGRITALYSGEILRDNASKIFPPVPGIFDFPIPDTLAELPLPVNGSYRIDRGIFDNTNISFKFRHDQKELVKVIMQIVSVSKDNVIWQKEYNLNFADDSDGEISGELSNLNGWLALPNNNKIKFYYQAFRPNGEKIKLNYAAMNFDLLRFSYLDGYFGNHTFDIKGDIISINIFDRWKSGGLEILNPRITLNVDNAFGFPVRSKVNQLTLKTVGGQLLNVESEYINKGIDFAFPTIDQVGQTKNTVFNFDGSNSNVGSLFQDKIIQVIYDFDALANPDGDVGVKNFYTKDAFFSVKVDVEIPMNLKSNQFTIADTIALDFKEFEKVDAASFKIKTENSFPVDMKVEAFFLDNAGNVIEQLHPNEAISIKAAPLNTQGVTVGKSVNETNISFDSARFAKVKSSKKILAIASFDTSANSSSPLWMYSNYGMDIKIGAIAKIK